MSLPLLATSPTVRLQVNAARELEADVVTATPNINNAMRTADGLYVRRGVRRDAWNLTRVAGSITTATQTGQVITWANEVLDSDGMADLVAQPTRITVVEAGYYWSRPALTLVQVGGSAAAQDYSGNLYVLKNGTTWINGQSLVSNTTGTINNNPQVSAPSYLHLAAGDYLELYFRWVVFLALNATSFAYSATWSGARIAP